VGNEVKCQLGEEVNPKQKEQPKNKVSPLYLLYCPLHDMKIDRFKFLALFMQ
jgi:hypothetical protein